MKTRKNMKRIVAVLFGLIFLFLIFKIFAITSYARMANPINSIDWYEFDFEEYDPGPFIASCSISVSGSNAAVYDGYGTVHSYDKYKEVTGQTIEELEGTHAIAYNAELDGYANPNTNVTITITLPGSVRTIYDTESAFYADDFTLVSVSGNTLVISGMADSYGEFYVDFMIMEGLFGTETPNWLDPLQTQLNIAADEEFGGNVKHTAEYTGNFALPKKVMEFLKDHPNTTLIYTYMRDELTPVTVKIEGSKVKLQDGVDWYGIDNLIKTYGVYKK